MLDLFSSLVFALCMSAFIQIGADSGQKHLDRILYAMFLGVVSYLATFILAICLRKKLKFIRSWAWMGIGGALVDILRVQLVALPVLWDYHQRFLPTTHIARDVISEMLYLVVVNWIGWALLGCASIFAIRFIAYFLTGTNQRAS